MVTMEEELTLDSMVVVMVEEVIESAEGETKKSTSWSMKEQNSGQVI